MSHDRHEIEDSVNYAECPIPKTHRSLVDAHVLWHQALDHYQEPEAFRANLNATIEALRNVTFKLQNEKSAFPEFDVWYRPHQERLKADPVCKWVHDARTTIVHQGELSANSTAVVKLVTWRDEPLLETAVAPDAPPELIFRNLPIVELLSGKKIPSGDIKTAAIIIERRWTVAGLETQEILSALAEAYGVLSEIVLEAHIRLGTTACIPAKAQHLHFPSTHDRTGTLRCMAAGHEQRIHRFELATGEQLREVNKRAKPVDPAVVLARYQFQKEGVRPDWYSADPLLAAEKILYIAKRMLVRDKAHTRILFLRDGGGVWRLVALNAENRAEKNLLMQMAARLVERIGGDAVIDVGEAWVISPAEAEKLASPDEFQHVAGRKELLQVSVATRDGLFRTFLTPFRRGPFGGIKLSDTQTSEDVRNCYYMEPIFAVWRKQRFVDLPEGERRPRLWEPDPLDRCFCGGPQRFADCCRALVQSKLDDTEEQINSAMNGKCFARAEALAKASLAQYVIWIRQHTVMTRHVASDLHSFLLGIDLPALEAHVRRLGRVLEANGHGDSFVPRVRSLSNLVGLPELSARLVAISAQQMLRVGDFPGAAKELGTLGDFADVKDTLAIVLAGHLMGWPFEEQRKALVRAGSAALTKEYRWLAELELSRCLVGCGLRDEEKESRYTEALKVVDGLISDLRKDDAPSELLGDALCLRWEITRTEDDYLAAKKQMEASAGPDHRSRLAGLMIDHGDFDDAENVLSNDLAENDPVAQLLMVDARLRANRLDASRDLFRNVIAERIGFPLEYPYAVTCALVALACGDADLRSLAKEKLQGLRSVDPHAREHINDLSRALDDDSLSTTQPILERLRNLLRHQR